jgi:hypothetical protein
MNEESITTERFNKLIQESDVLQSEAHSSGINSVEEILLQHPELGMITVILNDADNTTTLIY